MTERFSFRGIGMVTLALGGLTITACGGGGASADEFPSQPIEMIVPYSAGSLTDTTARPWAICLEEELGQRINVVNSEGGAAATGTSQLATAQPDGYTVSVSAVSPTAVVPALEDVGYDHTGFDTLGYLGHSPDVIYVRTTSELETFEDFADSIDEVSVADYNMRSASRFRSEDFKDNNDLAFESIPFDSADQKIRSVLSGDTDAGYDPIGPSLAEQVEGGELRLLAASNDLEAFPDVPTYQELGLESFAGDPAAEGSNTFLHVPAGVDEEVSNVWGEAIENCRDDEAVAELISTPGLPEDGISSDNAARMAELETNTYLEFIETHNLSDS